MLSCRREGNFLLSETLSLQGIQNHLSLAFLRRSKEGSSICTHGMWKNTPPTHSYRLLQVMIPDLEHRVPCEKQARVASSCLRVSA